MNKFYNNLIKYGNTFLRFIILISLGTNINVYLEYLNVYVQTKNLSNFSYVVDWYTLNKSIIINGTLFLILTGMSLSTIYCNKFLKLSILKGVLFKYTLNIIILCFTMYIVTFAHNNFDLTIYILTMLTILFVLNLYFQELYIILTKETNLKKAIKKNIAYNKELSTMYKTWIHGKILNIKWDIVTILSCLALYFISYVKKNESLIKFHNRTNF